MFDISRLQLLTELRRHGTMAAVADVLSYSTSAVSQQLRKLQAEAGVELFQRVGRTLVLTPAGELLADEADRVVEAVERAEAALAGVRGEAGTVRLGVVPTVAWVALSSIVEVLHEEDPQLQLIVSTFEPEDGGAALLARSIDIMVMDEYRGLPRKRQTGLQRVPLKSDQVQAVLPEGAPADADPAMLDWVFEPEGTEAAHWALAICREQGIEPRIRYHTPDFALQRQLVLDGLAAAFLPGIMRGGHEFRPVPGFPADLERQLYAVTRPGSSRKPAIERVISVLRSQLADGA